MIANQSLNPYRSVLLPVCVPDRVSWSKKWLYRFSTAENVPAFTLPPYLEVLDAAEEWRFQLSTTFVESLLDLFFAHGVDWDVSLLNYTHVSANRLRLKSARQTVHLFGHTFAGESSVDPLDYDAVLGHSVDDDILQFDHDFAAALVADNDGEQRNDAPVGVPPPVHPPPIRPALPGAVSIVGQNIIRRRDGGVVGKWSAMVQWMPPSFSMKCYHPDHISCTLTSDCTQQCFDSLIDWVAAADDFIDATAHKLARPAGLRC